MPWHEKHIQRLGWQRGENKPKLKRMLRNSWETTDINATFNISIVYQILAWYSDQKQFCRVIKIIYPAGEGISNFEWAALLVTDRWKKSIAAAASPLRESTYNSRVHSQYGTVIQK